MVLLAASLDAQEGATLIGVVKDSHGAAVMEAQVRLYRQDTGVVLRSASNEKGDFRFERLAAGTFIVEVEKENFRGSTTAVRIEGSATATADIVLSVAGVSESVIVTAAGTPQQLDEISKAVSVITSDEVQNRNE